MFFLKAKKSALDEVLEPLPLEVRKIVVKATLPYDVALTWWLDSGAKFNGSDVTTMANSLINRLPQ
jgi:hypothetical protein